MQGKYEYLIKSMHGNRDSKSVQEIQISQSEVMEILDLSEFMVVCLLIWQFYF